MEEIEKLLEKVRTLFYQSKTFTFALIAGVALVTIAFPGFMALVVSTTVVFVFIKGVILLLGMISDK